MHQLNASVLLFKITHLIGITAQLKICNAFLGSFQTCNFFYKHKSCSIRYITNIDVQKKVTRSYGL